MAIRAYALIQKMNVNENDLLVDVFISLYPIQGPFSSNQFTRTYPVIGDLDALPAAIKNAIKAALSAEAQALGHNLTTANIFVSDLG